MSSKNFVEKKAFSNEVVDSSLGKDELYKASRALFQMKVPNWVILVNSKSGGNKGLPIVNCCLKFDAKIHEMHKMSQLESLELLSEDLYNLKDDCIVLLAGGDGSMSWACDIIDSALNYLSSKKNVSMPFPCIVPFPVGTGNDLSRVSGWGNFEVIPKNIGTILSDICYCKKMKQRIVQLDRWRITYYFDDIVEATSTIKAAQKDYDFLFNYKNRSKATANVCTRHNIEYIIQNNPQSKTYKYIHENFSPPLASRFLCYLSFGYDAQVAYTFVSSREKMPKLHQNQISNQVMYFLHGIPHFFGITVPPICDHLEIYIDGKEVQLSKNDRSFKLCNINSMADGIFFWGDSDKPSAKDDHKSFEKPLLNDKMIECVSEKGAQDFLKTRYINQFRAKRISQAKKNITVVIKKVPIAFQVDGEAYLICKKGKFVIERHDCLPLLIGYSKPRGVPPELLNDKFSTVFRHDVAYKFFNDYFCPGHKKSKSTFLL